MRRPQRATAALVALVVMTGCARGDGGRATVTDEPPERTAVRFVAEDGRLDPSTVGTVRRRLRTAGLDADVTFDELGLTVLVRDRDGDGADLARLATRGRSLAVRTAASETAMACDATRPAGTEVVLPDVLTAAGCWPAGPAIVEPAQVTDAAASTDRPGAVVLGVDAAAAAALDATARQGDVRRLVVVLDGFVVSAPRLDGRGLGARITIDVGGERHAELVAMVLSSPQLADRLAEPAETGPSGFGPSAGGE